MAKTPIKSFRISENVWQAALLKAREEDTTLTKLIVSYLESYSEKETTSGRWLAEVKAQAWAEGAVAVHQYFDYFPNTDIPRNPYNQGENK